MKAQTGHSGSGRIAAIVSIFLTIALFAGACWVLLNRQYVIDQATVWQYQPSAEIEQLVRNTSMSETGKFYFYASTPHLYADKDAFNSSCPRQEESSAILGCYAARVIYIYDVPDERLQSVPEVTAAHEMLHAAYDRLGNQEKQRINTLLDSEYKKLLDSENEGLKERMQYYARTEPGERDNELHSIIGTEVQDISEELEMYYSKYFSDRQVVIGLHDLYNSRFAELRDNSEALKTELEKLSTQIKSMSDQYNADISALNKDIEAFNNRADAGGFSSQSAFGAARAELVERIDLLKRTRSDIDAKVVDYEAKRQTYNATVDESNSLTRSLDSSLSPAPSI
jgi:cell division septum initiation protein DivIVA